MALQLENMRTLQAITGEWVGKYKDSHALTLEQIAQTSRKYGAKWAESMVYKIISGRASESFGVVILAVRVIGDLVGTDFCLSDILEDVPGSEHVELSSGIVLDARTLKSILDGAELDFDTYPSTSAADITKSELEQVMAAQLASVSALRTARRLNLSIDQLDAVCQRIWGHGYDEELDARSTGVTSPQARGHITRTLQDDIQERLDQEAQAMQDLVQDPAAYERLLASTGQMSDQWYADHADEMDAVAKTGDTLAEQEGMEEQP